MTASKQSVVILQIQHVMYLHKTAYVAVFDIKFICQGQFSILSSFSIEKSKKDGISIAIRYWAIAAAQLARNFEKSSFLI